MPGTPWAQSPFSHLVASEASHQQPLPGNTSKTLWDAWKDPGCTFRRLEFYSLLTDNLSEPFSSVIRKLLVHASDSISELQVVFCGRWVFLRGNVTWKDLQCPLPLWHHSVYCEHSRQQCRGAEASRSSTLSQGCSFVYVPVILGKGGNTCIFYTLSRCYSGFFFFFNPLRNKNLLQYLFNINLLTSLLFPLVSRGILATCIICSPHPAQCFISYKDPAFGSLFPPLLSLDKL